MKPAAFRVTSPLYKNTRLALTTVPLLRGYVAGKDAVADPGAWANTAQDRPVFYNSMGDPEDCPVPALSCLLLHGILWCLRDPLPPAGFPPK